MPFAFPSHQGLIAPLWRRWPHRFAVLPLWIGAMAPDLVDGIENLIAGGPFHQWIGHSPVGATVLGVPLALLLTWVLRRAVVRGTGAFARWIRSLEIRPAGSRLRTDAWSAWIGALSHVLFDLPTHERSRLLWPLAEDPAWFGEWWRTAWFRVSAPGYPDYPIGPHFVAWVALTVVGAVMFCRWRPRGPSHHAE